MLNKKGKLACMLALPAFLNSQAITLFFDLAPLVNVTLTPFCSVEQILTGHQFQEPSFTNMPLCIVDKQEAVIAGWILIVMLCVAALYLAMVAARNHEHSLWYGNGFFLSFLSLYSMNPWVGGIVITSIMLFLQQRRISFIKEIRSNNT